jgi:hypothetical protein
MDVGYQNRNGKANSFYAWAVQSGDTSTVPLPAAQLLFSSGLIVCQHARKLRNDSTRFTSDDDIGRRF